MLSQVTRTPRDTNEAAFCASLHLLLRRSDGFDSPSLAGASGAAHGPAGIESSDAENNYFKALKIELGT